MCVEKKSSLKTIGLNMKSWVRDVFLGVSAYSVVLPMLVGIILVLSIVIKLIQYEPPPHPLVDIFVVEDKQNPWLIGLCIFLACTVGPIIEEIFFRGFCYTALKKKWGVACALVVSALFFAGIHMSLFAFFPVFVLGLVSRVLV